MSAEQNIQAAQASYAAFARGDVPGVLANLDESIEWVVPEVAGMPGTGTRHGHAGVTEFLNANREYWEFESFDPREYHASGDVVIVVGHSRGKARRTGLLAESHWVMLWRFRNGKCIHFQEYLDTAALEKALAGTRAAEA